MAVDAIATVQKYLPEQKIILYDLGGVKPRFEHQVYLYSRLHCVAMAKV